MADFPLTIARGPLVDLERGVSEYVLDEEAMGNASKHLIHLAFYIEEVIEKPFGIFVGLGRENFGEGLCYSGSPGALSTGDGRVQPGKTGEVLLVFAVREGSTIVVIKWSTRYADPVNRGLPDGFRQDFKTLAWERT
jgi:hypothetical protein